jgi:hypothetical protein
VRNPMVPEGMVPQPLADYYAGAKSVGPLASFDASDDWVEHPYRDGVAWLCPFTITVGSVPHSMCSTLTPGRTSAPAFSAAASSVSCITGWGKEKRGNCCGVVARRFRKPAPVPPST